MKIRELSDELQTLCHSGLSEMQITIEGKEKFEIKLVDGKIDIRGINGKAEVHNED